MSQADPGFVDRVAAALRFLEREPLSGWLDPAELARALRAAAGRPEEAAKAAERAGARFDEALARMRGSSASLTSVLGQGASEALVRAAGDAEPDEALVRSLFTERASEALLASLLYDGIIEFLRKMNSLGDLLPGVGFAKKLGGGLFGGLAGGLGEQIERRLEPQVKSFLQGFVKVALERGVKFVTAPANRQSFRETRERLARRALARTASEWVAAVPPDRIARAREELVRTVRARHEELAAESGPRSATALAQRVVERAGQRTIGQILDRYALLRLAPEAVARIIAPVMARATGGPPG